LPAVVIGKQIFECLGMLNRC